MITAENFLKHFYSKESLERLKVEYRNKTIILIYYPGFQSILKKVGFRFSKGLLGVYKNDNYPDIFFAGAKIGSAGFVDQIEQYNVLGFDKFIHIGLAGSFSEDINPGDIYISKGAFAESFIPYAYENVDFCFSSKTKNTWFLDYVFKPGDFLVNKLKDIMNSGDLKYFEGMHFTTDLPYKENFEKFERLKKKKAYIVEMEGAAFFAVCKSYKKEAASIYVISDKITKNKWLQKWDSQEVKNSIEKIIELLVEGFNIY